MASATGKGGFKQPKPGAHPGGSRIPGSGGSKKGRHPAASVKGARKGGKGKSFGQPARGRR